MFPTFQQVLSAIPTECSYYFFHFQGGLFLNHHQILSRKLLHSPNEPPCFCFDLHNRNKKMSPLCFISFLWLPMVLKIKPKPHPSASEVAHLSGPAHPLVALQMCQAPPCPRPCACPLFSIWISLLKVGSCIGELIDALVFPN